MNTQNMNIPFDKCCSQVHVLTRVNYSLDCFYAKATYHKHIRCIDLITALRSIVMGKSESKIDKDIQNVSKTMNIELTYMHLQY